ncbi:hypothetical protein CY34DRAFT_125847 [Suillus luteus UH-Slu-Lm8-n1]|uniref:Uncharacterized protein n=1 Tax=Suillus luteus UH-Slu-Lm8-n1 TaxID=930992 RepID=A0A0D0BE33_9AGAM|nr:hypothetical protein CY34DRAFT_125847 [Suillus luteus UH-Slu-Lm8-n1]
MGLQDNGTWKAKRRFSCQSRQGMNGCTQSSTRQTRPCLRLTENSLSIEKTST